MFYLDSSQLNEQFTTQLVAHQKYIYSFIYTLVSNRADAEDILQKTALVMCRKFSEMKSDEHFLAWSLNIARKEVYNFRRKCERSKVIFNDQAFEILMSQSDQIMNQVDQRKGALDQCLKKLNTEDRQLLQMRYEAGVTIKTIAENLDRPVQGLYKVFGRIHANLKECILKSLSRTQA